MHDYLFDSVSYHCADRRSFIITHEQCLFLLVGRLFDLFFYYCIPKEVKKTPRVDAMEVVIKIKCSTNTRRYHFKWVIFS